MLSINLGTMKIGLPLRRKQLLYPMTRSTLTLAFAGLAAQALHMDHLPYAGDAVTLLLLSLCIYLTLHADLPGHDY